MQLALDLTEKKKTERNLSLYETAVVNGILDYLMIPNLSVILEEVLTRNSYGEYVHNISARIIDEGRNVPRRIIQDLPPGRTEDGEFIERERKTLDTVLNYLRENYRKLLFQINDFELSGVSRGSRIRDIYEQRFTIRNKKTNHQPSIPV